MPCDTLTTQSVNLSKAMPGLLVEALKAEGWTIRESSAGLITAVKIGAGSLRWVYGAGLTVKGADNDGVIRSVTRAYGVKAVSWAAQRAGWTVNQQAENVLTVNRR